MTCLNKNPDDCRMKHYAVKDCPDCGDDLGCPNVRKAMQHKQAVAARYQSAMANHGAPERLREFYDAVKQQAKVVISVDFHYLDFFLSRNNNIYQPYYKQVATGIRRIAVEENHRKRTDVDNRLFTGFHENIVFAALSLNDTGAWAWGPYHLTIRWDAIQQRTSFTEYNTFCYREWFDKTMDAQGQEIETERQGYRATFENRAELACAKLAGKIDATTDRKSFAGILLAATGKRSEDDFLECHIFNGVTVAAVEQVRMPNDAEAKSYVKSYTPIQRKREVAVLKKHLATLANQGIAIVAN